MKRVIPQMSRIVKQGLKEKEEVSLILPEDLPFEDEVSGGPVSYLPRRKS